MDFNKEKYYDMYGPMTFDICERGKQVISDKTKQVHWERLFEKHLYSEKMCVLVEILERLDQGNVIGAQKTYFYFNSKDNDEKTEFLMNNIEYFASKKANYAKFAKGIIEKKEHMKNLSNLAPNYLKDFVVEYVSRYDTQTLELCERIISNIDDFGYRYTFDKLKDTKEYVFRTQKLKKAVNYYVHLKNALKGVLLFSDEGYAFYTDAKEQILGDQINDFIDQVKIKYIIEQIKERQEMSEIEDENEDEDEFGDNI